jgi:hypothetical protein
MDKQEVPGKSIHHSGYFLNSLMETLKAHNAGSTYKYQEIYDISPIVYDHSSEIRRYSSPSD